MPVVMLGNSIIDSLLSIQKNEKTTNQNIKTSKKLHTHDQFSYQTIVKYYFSCALIGGETAQMPGVYCEDEFDLAGTIVGIVEKAEAIDGSTIIPSDVVIGLESSGLHTNGKVYHKIGFVACCLKYPSDKVICCNNA